MDARGAGAHKGGNRGAAAADAADADDVAVPLCFFELYRSLQALDLDQLSKQAAKELRKQKKKAKEEDQEKKEKEEEEEEQEEEEVEEVEGFELEKANRKSVVALFWNSYLDLIHAANEHIHELPLRIAHVLVRQQRWHELQVLLLPLPFLRPLIVS